MSHTVSLFDGGGGVYQSASAVASPAAAAAAVAPRLGVVQYLDELWRSVRDDAADDDERDQPHTADPDATSDTDDDDDADATDVDESEEGVTSTVSGSRGSFLGLLTSLYRLPPPNTDFSSSTLPTEHDTVTQYVHLLPRHPNLVPIEEYACISNAATGGVTHRVQTREVPISLHSLLRFYQRPGLLSCTTSGVVSNGTLGDVFSAVQVKFMLFQLLSCLGWLHARGLVHGDLQPRHLLLTIRNGQVWLHVTGMRYALPSVAAPIGAFDRRVSSPFSIGESLLYQWWSGTLSNFDYLLHLNSLAGRESRGGFTQDVSFHPVMPWVVDFGATTANVDRLLPPSRRLRPLTAAELAPCIVYRDLSQSKYRLKKGDEQLDFQYANSFPNRPYHITEALSDITYFIYRSRLTPLTTLRRLVRSNFVAAEYPASMTKMYAWTPDECIPELYTDPSVFQASPDHRRHGMNDLQMPTWIPRADDNDAADGEQGTEEAHASFIAWHRAQLESEYVSRHLHEWIDLNWGTKLTGSAAVSAKNVPLAMDALTTGATPPATSKHATVTSGPDAATTRAHGHVFDLPRRPAFTQLFDRPHPPRRVLTTRDTKASIATTPAPAPMPIVIPTPSITAVTSSSSATATSSSPVSSSLTNLHSFEYFHACDVSFEASLAEGCYDAPPVGLAEWRRARAKHTARQRRRRRRTSRSYETSSEEEDEEEQEESDDDVNSPCIAAPAAPCTSLLERQANDVFAFGLLVAECFLARPLLTRRSALAYFASEHPPTLLDHQLRTLPFEAGQLVRRCLHLDWRARPTLASLLSDTDTLGLFRVHQAHPPHAGGPLTSNVIYQPFETLHRFLLQWRARIRRVAPHDEPTRVEWSLESDAAAASLHQGLLTPSSRLVSPVATSADLCLGRERGHSSTAFSFVTTPPFIASPNLSRRSSRHASLSSAALSPSPLPSPSSSPLPPMDPTPPQPPFWSCVLHGAPSAKESSCAIADAMQWLLHVGFEQLHSRVPLDVFALFVPHVCDLLLTPAFLYDAANFTLMRTVIDDLAVRLERHSERVLQPFLSHLFLHSGAPSRFHLAFVLDIASLRLLRARLVWSGLPSALLAVVRNSILSHRDDLALKAATVLTEFILVDLVPSSASVPSPPTTHGAPGLDLVAAGMRGNEEEILVFEILVPMFQRLATAPATHNKSNGGANASNPTTGAGAVAHASSVEKIMHFLLRIMADLSLPTLAHILLPNILALIEKGVGVVGGASSTVASSPNPRASVVGGRGGASGSHAVISELDVKLSHGLDLLYALLPDLHADLLHTLLNEGTLLKQLLLSIAQSSPPGSFAPMRAISAECMRKVLRIIVFIGAEFAHDETLALHAPSPKERAKEKEKSDLKSVTFAVRTRFAPFLTSVSDFCRAVVAQLESIASTYTAADLQGFLYALYVPLSSVIGRQQLQQAIVGSEKYEKLIQDHAKVRFLTATNPPDETDNMADSTRVRNHALRGKTARAQWPMREATRETVRRGLREAHQAERASMAAQLGIVLPSEEVAPSWVLVSTTDTTTQKRDSEPTADAADADDGSTARNVRVGRTYSRSDRRSVEDVAIEMEVTVDAATTATAADDDDDDDDAKSTPRRGSVVVNNNNRKKGFFKTMPVFKSGIFARAATTPTTPNSNTGNAAAATALANTTPGANTPTTTPTGASTPAPGASPSTYSMWTPVDFGDILLPTATISAVTPTTQRFDPHLRSVLRAHAGTVTCIDADPSSGLFLTSSRSGDSAPTVKLWSLTMSQAAVRPLMAYTKSSSRAHPRQTVLGVQLLTNPREYIQHAFAYCDGTQVHLVDIETNKPLLFRDAAAHASAQVQPAAYTPTANATTAKSMTSARPPSHDALFFGTSLLRTSSHYSKADLAQVGGITCFDYMADHHSLVLGTTLASVRMLDLRTGGGYLSSAWMHAGPSSSLTPAVRCVATPHEEGAESHLIFTGLSTGEIGVFDVRTGAALHQWRAHEAAVSQLIVVASDGHTLLVSSGLDNAICVWAVAAKAVTVTLHQRFAGLEENARGMMVRHQRDLAAERELVCTVGHKIGVGIIASPRTTKKINSKLTLTTVHAHKGKNAFTALAYLPTYDFTIIGQEDGKILLTK